MDSRHSFHMCLLMAMVVNILSFNIARETFIRDTRTRSLTHYEPQKSMIKDLRTSYYNDFPLGITGRDDYDDISMTSSKYPLGIRDSNEEFEKKVDLQTTSRIRLIENFPRKIFMHKQTFDASPSKLLQSKVRNPNKDIFWWKQKQKKSKRFRLLDPDKPYEHLPMDYPRTSLSENHQIPTPSELPSEEETKYQLGKDIMDKAMVYGYQYYENGEEGDGSTSQQLTDPLEQQASDGHEEEKLNSRNSQPGSEMLPSAQRRLALEDEGTQRDRKLVGPLAGKWDPQDLRFTTITVGSLMIFLIFVVMVLALRVHCRNRDKAAQEWIRHPMVQPTTAVSDGVQPNLKHILNSSQLSSEPVRIKAKGLLERRGSNTSLTIDLGSSSEAAEVSFASSKECTPEDFLMTAGSRMGRRQLRMCLRDPRDLHAEFSQIPTNHPDRCSVPGAAAKNRYRTVLPNEETRVVLQNAPPDSPETPASQYINANYIRGYDGEDRSYIAMQGPLAHTIEDLWLMVLQERCPAVVMITRLKEKGRVKCEPYVPNYSATYGSVHVTVKQVLQKNGYSIRQIFVKRGDEMHTTLHFWFTSWPDHKAPSSARHLLAMATEVESARKDSPRGPVAVHCSAGIGRTGCFIAISIGIHQLLEEDCVDVLSIVCQMRLDRGGMVQTAEQYEFIHRALAFYEATLPCNTSSVE